MNEIPRAARIDPWMRGVAIGVIALVYAYVTRQPGASLAVSLLIAACLQAAVLLLRRIVPADLLPQVMALFELLADAATVLLFALGVYGGMMRLAEVA
jgi:hypothetical protein